MKYYFVILLFLVSNSITYSQTVVSIKRYKTSTGWEVSTNDSILLGNPVMGTRYQSIKKSKLDKAQNQYLEEDLNNHKYLVNNLVKYKWQDGSEEIFAEIKVKGEKFYINLLPSLVYRELQLPSGYEYPDSSILISMNERFDVFIDSITTIGNDIIYEKIIIVEGMTKDQIFINLRQMFADIFKDSKYVLEINDKETGQLMGKGSMKIQRKSGIFWEHNNVSFTINIMVKEGRFKFRISSFRSEIVTDVLLTNDGPSSRDYYMYDVYQSYLGKGRYSKGIMKMTKSYLKGLLEDMLKVTFTMEAYINDALKSHNDMSDF